MNKLNSGEISGSKATSMTTAVFWVVGGSLPTFQRWLYSIALIMVAASTSETSVNFYQTTRRNNPEDSHIQVESSLHIDISLRSILILSSHDSQASSDLFP
jgi:hypothetical protein